MSTYTLLLLTGFLLFSAVALTALILATRNASEGYEDETGFHAGRPRPGVVRTIPPGSPALEQPYKIMLMPDVPIRSLILAPGASPKPPLMDPALAAALPSAGTPLVPVNIPFSSLKLPAEELPPEELPASKRKRRSARKDGPPDGSQMGFPGFAA